MWDCRSHNKLQTFLHKEPELAHAAGVAAGPMHDIMQAANINAKLAVEEGADVTQKVIKTLNEHPQLAEGPGGLAGAVEKAVEAERSSAAAARASESAAQGADAQSQLPRLQQQTGMPAQNIRFNEKNINHIFRDDEGHFKTDTPENRRLLIETTQNKDNLLGTDQYGTEWYAKMTPNGKQVWTQVRNGEIRNAGINDVPREFNSKTGLSSLTKPT